MAWTTADSESDKAVGSTTVLHTRYSLRLPTYTTRRLIHISRNGISSNQTPPLPKKSHNTSKTPTHDQYNIPTVRHVVCTKPQPPYPTTTPPNIPSRLQPQLSVQLKKKKKKKKILTGTQQQLTPQTSSPEGSKQASTQTAPPSRPSIKHHQVMALSTPH
ncbi:uncharacterized protein K452DRAFT_66304 [Aplosporella prunicola CBS 121167]|uniref:Uncharacterized protein n=1 Tax=Aplosporella prunicola CBS 121167 TaxID=1176127 RepID=A0A6A6BSS6_9PEZI|nr:uncharacterized protein K452DRAFT_66304 [Aplosporella prunicola CBS 121167]KAF2146483.1 hypothetical protein K452DRAFT_66304 [Aplosporella prunicola CBS 121167]